MTTTRALVTGAHGARPSVRTVVLDPLGERDVLVEIAAAAVCRTELLTIDRDGPATVLGHAAMGTVTSVGAAVTRVRVGDAVVVPGTRQCGACFMCDNGAPGACDEIFEYFERRVGVDSDGEVIWSDGGTGTHAERMVFVESNVVRVEGLLDAEVLALLGCGVTSGAGAVLDVAKVRPGQSVAISGCGHLGLWMVQAARLGGATTIIAIDDHPNRRDLALAMGATHAIDTGDDVVESVRALTGGRGADVALEAAGTTLAMEQSLAMSRLGGTVVPTGLESEHAVVRLSNLEYALGSRTIVGSQCGGGDVLRLIPEYEGMLARGDLDAASIITARYPLEGAAAVYDAIADPHHLTGIIVMPSSRRSER